MYCVIAFDIHDDKRRRKAVKLLLSYGIRVQYSVFEGYFEKKQLDKLSAGLRRILSDDDSLRIYALSEYSITAIGTANTNNALNKNYLII